MWSIKTTPIFVMACGLLLCSGTHGSHAQQTNTAQSSANKTGPNSTKPAAAAVSPASHILAPQGHPQKPGKDLRLEDFPAPGIVPALSEVARAYTVMNEELRRQIHNFQDELAMALDSLLYSAAPKVTPKTMKRKKRQATSGNVGTLSTNPYTVGGLGLAQGLNLGVNSLLSSGIRLSNFLTDFSTGVSQLLLGGLVGSGTNLDGGRVTNANANNGLG